MKPERRLSTLASALAAPAALLVTTLSGSALASPTFPSVVQSHWSLSYAPTCSTCHQNGQTGLGTVTTPFGVSLRAAGAKAQDENALMAALDTIAANNTDSDGDGVSDMEELVAGTNPNGTSGGASAAAPDPAFGCAASVAPQPASPTGALFFVAAAVGVLALRRRKNAGLLAVLAASAALAGCYDVSYVSADVCSTGLKWTGGDSGSPAMNPGLACIDCHANNDGPQFTFAGTAFAKRAEGDTCFGEPEAKIIVTGADNKSIELGTNEAGNFYTSLQVALPYRAMIVVGDKQEVMATPQTSGDCNSCHTETGANGAPGRISLP